MNSFAESDLQTPRTWNGIKARNSPALPTNSHIEMTQHRQPETIKPVQTGSYRPSGSSLPRAEEVKSSGEYVNSSGQPSTVAPQTGGSYKQARQSSMPSTVEVKPNNTTSGYQSR